MGVLSSNDTTEGDSPLGGLIAQAAASALLAQEYML
tara:strand:- start:505 stop:612 length:108 start_codon:yes stop_codon:yes gene_type:complete